MALTGEIQALEIKVASMEDLAEEIKEDSMEVMAEDSMGALEEALEMALMILVLEDISEDKCKHILLYQINLSSSKCQCMIMSLHLTQAM